MPPGVTALRERRPDGRWVYVCECGHKVSHTGTAAEAERLYLLHVNESRDHGGWR